MVSGVPGPPLSHIYCHKCVTDSVNTNGCIGTFELHDMGSGVKEKQQEKKHGLLNTALFTECPLHTIKNLFLCVECWELG